MRSFFYLCILAVIALQGCGSKAGPASERPVKAAAPTMSFAVAAGECSGQGCQIFLRLLDHDRLLDTVPLDFKASSAELNKEEASPLMGARDALSPLPPPQAYVAGDEEGMVATSLQPFRLAGTQDAVLVHQMAGFDHTKRRHYVFIVTNWKLQRVWDSKEGVGPTWSAAIVDPDAKGASRSIIFLNGFSPGGNEVDRLDATRLNWDAAKNRFSPGGDAQLFAIVAGKYADASAAHAAIQAQPCLGRYWVLPAKRVGTGDVGVVLALVSIHRHWAAAALAKDSDGCKGNLQPRFAEVED
jgi:hypothetical protein